MGVRIFRNITVGNIHWKRTVRAVAASGATHSPAVIAGAHFVSTARAVAGAGVRACSHGGGCQQGSNSDFQEHLEMRVVE
jgi:hypothetical protein